MGLAKDRQFLFMKIGGGCLQNTKTFYVSCATHTTRHLAMINAFPSSQ